MCQRQTQKSWPSAKVWDFIAQLVEQRSADTAEAMGFDAVEAPFFFLFFIFVRAYT